jgi:carbonic anhydrase/acetyltransferase-like protein (isoleucine patch superfamily)
MAVYALGALVPQIDPEAFVHPDATVIGDVHLGPDTTVWPHAVLRGDYGRITVGARTSIQDGSVIHATAMYPTTIGDDCVIGHLVHMECCTIGNGALVGSGSIVLHRAVVHDEALVGAAALVPNDMEVPSRAMALGVPAKLRLDAVDPEFMIQMGARQYIENGRRYREGLRRIDEGRPRGRASEIGGPPGPGALGPEARDRGPAT